MDVRNVTGAYTTLVGDRGDLIRLTDSAAQAVTLSSALADEFAMSLENANTGAGVAQFVTLTPSTGTITCEGVTGLASLILCRGDIVTVIFDGTSIWYVTYLQKGEIYSLNTSDFSFPYVSNDTLYPYLLAAGDTLTVLAASRYAFETQIHLTHGNTTHTTAFGFAGTATFTDINYDSILWAGAGGQSIATAQSTKNTIVSTITVLNATGGAGAVDINIKGTFAINAAGTIIPSIAWNADPTGTYLSKTGTYFRARKIGINTEVSRGQWA